MAQCKCGCGIEVKGEFAQGHDARFKGELLRRMRSWYDTSAMDELTGNGWLQKPFKFGVEIEFSSHGFNKAQFITMAFEAGIEVMEPGYTHEVMANWKLVTDSSCGYELVSPPMASTKDNFKQIATLCELLRANGAQVNASCGLHVHINAEHMDPKAVARTVSLYTQLRGEIDSMVSVSRRSNQYCRPLDCWQVAGVKLAADMGKKQLKKYGRDTNRYVVVNTQAYHKYGTLEFRQHQGTLNATKIEMWARFVAGLMAVATEPMSDTVNWEGRVYDAASMPPAQREYWEARRAELAR